MEDALLPKCKRVEKSKWELFVEEVKKVSYIAAPMVVVTVSQHLARVVSMMMVGHLGELSLSGAAVATSLTNVTGLSLLFGMASALETLCGQSFGAEQYQKLGIYTYAAVISLVVVSVPISVLWIFMDKLLIFMGQDPSISIEAGRYAIWLIPALFPYAILQSLIRFLQTQSLILPMLLSSIAALFFHVPVCWALIFKVKLGIAGAALAIGLSYWFNVILLILYVKCSSTCKETRAPFSRDVLPRMKEFFCFAVPSAVMVCLEWWSFEIVVLLSGLLPNPQLETSVLSICTRVSNELGAGFPDIAHASVCAAMVLSLSEAIIACTILLSSSHVFGYAFSNKTEVVDYLQEITPFVCLLLVMDCIQAVLSGLTSSSTFLHHFLPLNHHLVATGIVKTILSSCSGVARGSGWQHLGAYVNLGAYYLVGLPIAAVFGFVLHLCGKGLWFGLNVGSVSQSILLSLITCLTNWKQQASLARQRLVEGDNSC